MGRRRPNERRGLAARVLVAVLGLGAAIAFATPAAEASASSNPYPSVLVIYGSDRGFVPYERFHARLLSTLESDPNRHVNVRAEFLDAMVLRGGAYEAAVVEYLRQKYGQDGVAVVVGVGAMAARLAVRVRAQVFPSASLVYGNIDERIASTIDFGGNATGVTGVVDITETTGFAMQLVPDVRHVAFVAGASDLERAWYDRVAPDIRAASAAVDVIPLFGLARTELMARLAALPPGSIVVWGSFYRDANGSSFDAREVLSEACTAANAPIFVLFTYDVGSGAVGGRVVDSGEQGGQTGELISRVLGGERADVVPPIHDTTNPAYVDWRAMRRWGIDERRLPPDAVVFYREPGIWDLYGRYILGGGVILALQSMLIVGLMLQRSRRIRDRNSLAERLRFEQLIAELSARFVDLPEERVDAAIDEGLSEILRLFAADRVSLIEFARDHLNARVSHSATADGVEPLPDVVAADEFVNLIDSVRGGCVVQFSTPEEIPADLARLRAQVERRGVRSGVFVPLHTAGTAFGLLRVTTLRANRTWPPDAATRLTMLADIFANALLRKRASAELQQSQALGEAVLASLNAQVCVVDRMGRVVAVNDAWRNAADGHGLHQCLLTGQHCGAAANAGVECSAVDGSALSEGIRGVLDGLQDAYTAEYRAETPGADRWYQMTVERLRAPHGGAVISHQNITARKRAELEAEQRRQELAHVSRVSTMGELAAAIAHELNQPLTGVLTNAQAAQRYLAQDPPDLSEVNEILRDIIEDDRRAGEVIRRLRSMLQTGAIEPADVDVNEIVTDVVRLIGSDAVLRGVNIETALARGPLRVHGDRIQLQQVILNLVVNAMDAMKNANVLDRSVTVLTSAHDGDTILVSVADRGPGIDRDKLGRIFQPFFTTKRDGLGMGLSIARSIVEAHGGMLWAVNNPDCGASFLCRLPAYMAQERNEALTASA